MSLTCFHVFEVLMQVFHRLADEAEVHVDLLTQSLELLGTALKGLL